MNRYYVRLKIVSQDLTAEEITVFTGLKPDRTWKIGDLRPKTIIKEKQNGWLIQSLLSKEESLESHVENLLNRLRPFASKLLELSTKVEIQFSCVAYDVSPPALFFKKDIIAQISALGASLDIDLYIVP